jgi:bifunctional non-homologous end joining protein LigD
LAHVEGGRCWLISRQGHRFSAFAALCEAILRELQADQAILDGELVCLNPKDGRSQFTELLHRRADPFFYAFDLLSINGEDLRGLPLLDRKRWLKAIMPDLPSRLLYVNHLEGRGEEFFKLCCQWDLEGMVAKRKDGEYISDRRRQSTWIKIKNPTYSQRMGRQDLFSPPSRGEP